jgi:tetratricopeptide (TPR) repeat protein
MKRKWVKKAIALSLAGTVLYLGSCTTKTGIQDGAGFPPSPETLAGSARTMGEFFSNVRPQPGNPDSHYLLGRYYQDQGEHGKAIEEFQKAALIDPEYAPAYGSMGVSYDQLQDYPRAISAYKTALRLNPRLGDLHNNLGYSFLLQSNADAAIPAFKEAIALNGREARFHNNLGLAYALKGQLDLAMAEFQQGGSEAKAHFNIAQFYYRQGLYSVAKLHYSLALRLDPSFTHARVAWDAVTSLAGIFQPEPVKIESKRGAEVSSKEGPIKLPMPPPPRVRNIQDAQPTIDHREANGTSDSPSSNSQSPFGETRNSPEEMAGIRPSIPASKTDAGSPGVFVATNSPGKGKTSPPVNVGIEISNGNGADGLARRVGRQLQEKGLSVKRFTNADHFHHPHTKIYYRDGFYDAAYRVAGELPAFREIQRKEKWDWPNIHVKVLIGKDILPKEAGKGKERSS